MALVVDSIEILSLLLNQEALFDFIKLVSAQGDNKICTFS